MSTINRAVDQTFELSGWKLPERQKESLSALIKADDDYTAMSIQKARRRIRILTIGQMEDMDCPFPPEPTEE
jgi:hypothetical protein